MVYDTAQGEGERISLLLVIYRHAAVFSQFTLRPNTISPSERVAAPFRENWLELVFTAHHSGTNSRSCRNCRVLAVTSFDFIGNNKHMSTSASGLSIMNLPLGVV